MQCVPIQICIRCILYAYPFPITVCSPTRVSSSASTVQQHMLQLLWRRGDKHNKYRFSKKTKKQKIPIQTQEKIHLTFETFEM